MICLAFHIKKSILLPKSVTNIFSLNNHPGGLQWTGLYHNLYFSFNRDYYEFYDYNMEMDEDGTNTSQLMNIVYPFGPDGGSRVMSLRHGYMSDNCSAPREGKSQPTCRESLPEQCSVLFQGKVQIAYYKFPTFNCYLQIANCPL